MRSLNLLSVAGLLTLIVVPLIYMSSAGLDLAPNLGVRNASLVAHDSNGLVVGSKVLFRGTEIGRVTDLRATANGVNVNFNYRDDYQLPADAAFRIDNLSALGETYINVRPGRASAPPLANDAVIEAGNIEEPSTFSEFADRLTRLLEQVGNDEVRRIIEETNKGLPRDREVLVNLVRANTMLESTFLRTRGAFTQLLDRLQPLLERGAGVSGEMHDAGPPTRLVMGELRRFLDVGADKAIILGDAPKMVTEGFGPLVEHLQSFLDRTAPDLKILGGVFEPSVTAAAAQLRTVDLGQLMQTALATAGTGDGITINAPR